MQQALQSHELCAVCAPVERNFYSLDVAYHSDPNGNIEGCFTVLPRHQGYLGLLHGGIASSLLDGAMTHCLLTRGIPALTAHLDVRFHQPVNVGDHVFVTATCVGKKRGIYQLSGQLLVDGEVRVSAKAKFIQPK
ncbi:PaaI family thioesterase [Vibrio sp. CAU 1672]|uniref:PaaI family thioesterase n=1 Tax=Vibrio sp. CAU 1672 TaxID=3032594 RepID=UPI0023DA95C9|nr:PaaI family thioesterase [Vibrio sp. CAU 1672]MDF2153354.1 PaaI family thioesterase [Vibrio sp. CAU 1672]